MNIHEYQAKELLARYGVPVPKGIPVDTAEQAAKAFSDLGGGLAVVKAQIHAGGRGKAGGVKLVRTADDARKIAEGLIGKALVTPQTGPEGRVVKKLYVTQGADIARIAALIADLPIETAGVTINRNCGSSLTAINHAVMSIAASCEDVQIAGGVEHMDHIPMTKDYNPCPSLFRKHSEGIMMMEIGRAHV